MVILASEPDAMLKEILILNSFSFEDKDPILKRLKPGLTLRHRGLKLDGAIGQGEICNSLKSENFSKSFLSHIGKNKIKF